MATTIHSLELENVKRIKAVKLEPSPTGLTVIGGKNGQGKTSVLDSIAWALGGDRFRPSAAQREGSVIPPALKITLSNGLIVERKGKNSDLKVIDPQGRKSGQQLLNSFISQLALDLPRFMEASSKEKAETLLQIIGVGERLYELEHTETNLYNKRHAIGQIADRKKKYADEMTSYPDVPDAPVSASELIRQQQDILAKNAENRRLRERRAQIEAQANALAEERARIDRELTQTLAELERANKDALFLEDESTAELERNIEEIETINAKVRANLDKEKAKEDAKTCMQEYEALTLELEKVRAEKKTLLDGADLPLKGLSVEDGELVYRGFRWDNMSGSDQLKVATAIVRKLNPQCGFVLLDKLEQMDLDTLRDFGAWLEAEGLQVIATRVSTGPECSVIITDGYVQENAAAPLPRWEGKA